MVQHTPGPNPLWGTKQAVCPGIVQPDMLLCNWTCYCAIGCVVVQSGMPLRNRMCHCAIHGAIGHVTCAIGHVTVQSGMLLCNQQACDMLMATSGGPSLKMRPATTCFHPLSINYLQNKPCLHDPQRCYIERDRNTKTKKTCSSQVIRIQNIRVQTERL